MLYAIISTDKTLFCTGSLYTALLILQDDSIAPVSERTLPVGCMQLVFHKGKQLLLLGESELQPQSFISGQSVGFSDVMSTGRIEMITVVFQPYAVKALFHIPSHLFRGQTVDTDAMEDVELSDLVKQVTDTSDNAVCIWLIEQFFFVVYTLFPSIISSGCLLSFMK